VAEKVIQRAKRVSPNLAESALLATGHPSVYDYAELRPELVFGDALEPYQYPCVVPNWDNTPRSGRNGVVLQGSTPSLFRRHVSAAVRLLAERQDQTRILFVKAWNEWAEGNYIEPDRRFGRGWLEAVAAEVLEDD